MTNETLIPDFETLIVRIEEAFAHAVADSDLGRAERLIALAVLVDEERREAQGADRAS